MSTVASSLSDSQHSGRFRPEGSASAPETAELYSGLGYEPVVVDISEFEKLEGCVTCLSVRLRELYV